MLSNEKSQFNELLMNLFSIYNKEPDQNVYDMWFSIMEKYPLGEIKFAFSKYAENVKYPPIPAAVIDFIPSKPRTIVAEEAFDYIRKLGGNSGYVTSRMLRALEVAEDSLAEGDIKSARFAFINTYNNQPDDDKFFYSGGAGVDYENEARIKIEALNLLESKKWVSNEKMMLMKPKVLRMTDSGSSKTKTKSNKEQAAKLRLIMQGMLDSSQSDTGAE